MSNPIHDLMDGYEPDFPVEPSAKPAPRAEDVSDHEARDGIEHYYGRTTSGDFPIAGCSVFVLLFALALIFVAGFAHSCGISNEHAHARDLGLE